jgi:hypothetical protein
MIGEAEEWFGGRWINVNRAKRGPFRWDGKDRVIRDAQNYIMVGLFTVITPGEGPSIVERWNEEYATWLMVKPT